MCFRRSLRVPGRPAPLEFTAPAVPCPSLYGGQPASVPSSFHVGIMKPLGHEQEAPQCQQELSHCSPFASRRLGLLVPGGVLSPPNPAGGAPIRHATLGEAGGEPGADRGGRGGLGGVGWGCPGYKAWPPPAAFGTAGTPGCWTVGRQAGLGRRDPKRSVPPGAGVGAAGGAGPGDAGLGEDGVSRTGRMELLPGGGRGVSSGTVEREAGGRNGAAG